MVDPKASRFWQAALQSGLIDAKALQACFDAIVPEKRIAEQLDRRLARQAVQQGRLSLWQAQQLLAGRSSGFKINRYTLLEMIGQGGMGRVYLAKDTRLNRRVALKILSPERMNNPRAITRFQREARVGAQLQHENLVRIYDEGEANGKCYLVMEYIEGKNLGAVLAENGPIPPPTAARLAQQVALGLEHAQQKGLIHRDVNPYNILVTREGIAKLTDLGLAIDQSEEAQVTREGATVGTFDYVSPEQARHSHSVDTRSDIYSLGCTLYHILSGQVPFPSPSLPEKLFGHQAVEPASLTKLVPGIPEGLVKVVDKMMRKSPDERYATPLDVAQALEPYTDNPAGTVFGSPAAAVRSSGRASMTETQVVDAPRMGSAAGPAVAATQVATHLVEEALPRPLSALASAATTPATAPAAVAAPTSRSNESWGGLGLGIDLGPEPSLTEGLQSGKKKSRMSSSDISAEAPVAAAAADASAAAPVPPLPSVALTPMSTAAQAGRAPSTRAAASIGQTLRQRWLIGVGALGVAATLAGILFGFGLIGQAGPNGGSDGKANSATKAADPAKIVANRSQADATDPPEHASGTRTKKSVEFPPDQTFAVATRDGTVLSEPDIKSALQRAIGSKGHVLLNNRTPLKLTGADATVTSSGGPLHIRAADGVRPVLEVELKGQRPFLSTRTDTPLTITGVTIVARYSGHHKVIPPVIEAGGNITLERCAFIATGAVKGSRAVDVEGTNLTVNGCWFEGFDTALDIASFAGSSTTIKQSMMVRAGTDDQPIGWAVRLRKTLGGSSKSARRLVLEHCTIKGEGLLHLVDFSPQTGLRVDIKQCAVLADAVLAWQTPKPGTPLTAEALEWKGDGNLYDIRGKAWVVTSPEGTPELPDAPIDLATWRSRVIEQDPLPPPVRFRVSAESLSESPKPGDFAIIDPDVHPPGADPARVGPAAPQGS